MLTLAAIRSTTSASQRCHPLPWLILPPHHSVAMRHLPSTSLMPPKVIEQAGRGILTTTAQLIRHNRIRVIPITMRVVTPSNLLFLAQEGQIPRYRTITSPSLPHHQGISPAQFYPSILPTTSRLVQ